MVIYLKTNKLIKIILAIIMLLISLIMLSGCEGNNSNNTSEKISQELDFLDTKIVSILNKLNNIDKQNYTLISEEISMQDENQNQLSSSEDNKKITITQMQMKSTLSSDTNDINWEEIKSEIEIINNSWPVVLTDLSSINVNDEDILGFSNTLNKCTISIKNEDKLQSLKNLAELYSYIPKYEETIGDKEEIKNIKLTKSYLINAYSVIESEDWQAVNNYIIESEKSFNNIVDNIINMKNKEYKINKIYVLIEEMKSSIEYKDKELLYLKYKDLMENLNTF